ncbi:MAG: hypothetical protein GY725_19185, partial [bacterium]|nr:hypothetical protein [bacterium]
MNSRVHPKYKTKYRVTNWPEYERSLDRRGDITIWLTPEAIASWKGVVARIARSGQPPSSPTMSAGNRDRCRPTQLEHPVQDVAGDPHLDLL